MDYSFRFRSSEISVTSLSFYNQRNLDILYRTLKRAVAEFFSTMYSSMFNFLFTYLPKQFSHFSFTLYFKLHATLVFQILGQLYSINLLIFSFSKKKSLKHPSDFSVPLMPLMRLMRRILHYLKTTVQLKSHHITLNNFS